MMAISSDANAADSVEGIGADQHCQPRKADHEAQLDLATGGAEAVAHLRPGVPSNFFFQAVPAVDVIVL